jgi:hypothetical protein
MATIWIAGYWNSTSLRFQWERGGEVSTLTIRPASEYRVWYCLSFLSSVESISRRHMLEPVAAPNTAIAVWSAIRIAKTAGKIETRRQSRGFEPWSGIESEMAYLADGLTAVWVVGILVLAAVHLNDIRRLLNNLVPSAPLSGHIWNWSRRKHSLIKIDPALLNEAGRAYRTKAIRNERIMFAWMFGGFFLTACIHYYMNP